MNSRDPKPAAKKPYRKPALKLYGDVRKLTQNLGGTGKNDNMSSSSTKTGA
jgi:hypothetical protein